MRSTQPVRQHSGDLKDLEDNDPLQVRLDDLEKHLGDNDDGPRFIQHNLVSDGFVKPDHIDPNLINPWGISHSATSPFWISDAGSGVTTIYNAAGVAVAVGGQTTPVVIPGHTAVTIAAAPGQIGPSHPTGQVFNTGAPGFTITEGGKIASSAFIFATTNGTISGWAPSVDRASSVLAVDHSAAGAEYTGLTMLNGPTGTLLYAADFHGGKIEVFNSAFTRVNSFTDTSLPHGYAPFNVQALGGNVFVTFALQDPAGKFDVPGAHHGFVDEFDAQGHLIQRIASRGPLDSPWGLAIAPASFGKLAGDLLVGNFGDGTIDAFNLTTDKFDGKLLGCNDKPLVIEDLWGLIPGNGGDANTIYFTAGGPNAVHGLFGSLAPAPVIPDIDRM